MTILTDEIVEKAARGIVYCADLTCHCWRHHFDDARAALEAVLPDVVEMAAKECEKAASHAASFEGDRAMCAAAIATDIAAAIRALIPQEGK